MYVYVAKITVSKDFSDVYFPVVLVYIAINFNYVRIKIVPLSFITRTRKQTKNLVTQITLLIHHNIITIRLMMQVKY